jgi:hypothetical protein
LLAVVVWCGGELLERLESRFNTGLAGFRHRFKNTSKNAP